MKQSISNIFVPRGEPPLHVALLPDGARRWSVKNSVSLREAYRQSARHLSTAVSSLFIADCNEITLLLSNWRNHGRSKSEREAFECGIQEFVNVELIKYQSAWNCSIRLICPEHVAYGMKLTRHDWREGGNKRLNVCIAYDPLEEIFNAVDNAYQASKTIKSFPDFLWIDRPVDLAIRTGGFVVTSGFIPLQLCYARLYCIGALFNDTIESDFRSVIDEFLANGARYGE